MIFKEINPNEMERFNPKDFPDYYLSGEYTPPDRLFFYNECYIELSMIDGVPFLAILNNGEAKNLFKAKECVDWVLREYGKVGFYWKVGIKNETFIKRLLKNYKIISEVEEEDMMEVIFTKGE